jgi:Snf7
MHVLPRLSQTQQAFASHQSSAFCALASAAHGVQQDMLAERSLAAAAALLREGRRDRAAVALKKKKLHEKQALQLENNILLLDERAAALETSTQQADLVGTLKLATATIRAVQRQMPLEDVERLLEDSASAAQYVVRPVSHCVRRSAHAVTSAQVAVYVSARKSSTCYYCTRMLGAPVLRPCMTTPVLAVQNDVNALLGQSSEAVPDSELDEELAALEEAAMPSAPTKQQAAATALPAAPTHEAAEARVPAQEKIAIAEPSRLHSHAVSTQSSGAMPAVAAPVQASGHKAKVPVSDAGQQASKAKREPSVPGASERTATQAQQSTGSVAEPQDTTNEVSASPKPSARAIEVCSIACR